MTVQYDIVHSPSYQVPVLHITLPGLSPKVEQSQEAMYELLVPSAYKDQIRHVGVMGGLSMTEHPITGLPAYFVHPCLTQDAMLAQNMECDHSPPVMYLLRWIGLIGTSVGLSIPVALAESIAWDFEMHGKLERS